MAVTMADQLPGYGPPTPVPIFQWQPEFEALLDLYRDRKPKRVLEIGTYHGGTLYHWLRNAPKGATIVSLDSYAVGVDNRHLYDEWNVNDTRLVVLEGDSSKGKTVGAVEPYAPFDWVFIDAGHYYHEVKADWDNYRPLVQDGGLVCFHDILPPNHIHPEIEVAQLWEEIKQDYETLEIVADRDAYWGGIGVTTIP